MRLCTEAQGFFFMRDELKVSWQPDHHAASRKTYEVKLKFVRRSVSVQTKMAVAWMQLWAGAFTRSMDASHLILSIHNGRGLLTIYNSGGGTSVCACGTSPSSLPILLVCLTFPVVLSLSFSSSSSDFPCPPPNQLVEYLEAFGFGIKSVVFGMRRMWYERIAAGEVRSQSSRRAKFRRLDLNRLSRKSPIRGTMPTTQSIRTLKS